VGAIGDKAVNGLRQGHQFVGIEIHRPAFYNARFGNVYLNTEDRKPLKRFSPTIEP
jgi:hypothetical protein